MLDFQKYLSQRDETIAWLSHQTLILAACLKVIKKLEAGQSVIVHCRYYSPSYFFLYLAAVDRTNALLLITLPFSSSDGWDR